MLTAGAAFALHRRGPHGAKVGYGASLLIFTNIIGSLPSSFGQTLSQANEKGDSATVLPVFFGAFFLSALGIVCVQGGTQDSDELQHALQAGGLAKSSYLPFKVNSAGVMPIIFASSLLALPRRSRGSRRTR